MSPLSPVVAPTAVPFYQVDAFTDQALRGNPAAVMVLADWLPDDLLLAVAAENNLSETAFLCRLPAGGEADYAIRWFTPTCEVPLCGHATLSGALVVLDHLEPGRESVSFQTREKGVLTVRRGEGGLLVMDLPASKIRPVIIPEHLDYVLGVTPLEVLRDASNDLYVVLGSPQEVRQLAPRLAGFAQVKARGIIATAEAKREIDGCDFVCRYFAPGWGIDEDPVTGAIHTALVPFWSKRLGRDGLTSRQVSLRGGVLFCQNRGERTEIAGHAVLYLKGQAFL